MAEEHPGIEEPASWDQMPVADSLHDPQPAESRPPQREGGGLWRVAGVIILVVVVALIALLLRDCAGEGGGELGGDGAKVIVPVARYEPVAGVVSVWVSQDADIDNVLDGLEQLERDVVSMGGGRYIIVVEPGREQLMIDTLKAREGVHDAGLVYDKDAPVR